MNISSLPKFSLIGDGGTFKKVYKRNNINGKFIVPNPIDKSLGDNLLLLSMNDENSIKNELSLQKKLSEKNLSPKINKNFLKCIKLNNKNKQICNENSFFYVQKMLSFQNINIEISDLTIILDNFVKKCKKLAKLGYFNLDMKEENLVLNKSNDVFFIDTDPYYFVNIKQNSQRFIKAHVLLSLVFLLFNPVISLFPYGTRQLTFSNQKHKDILETYFIGFLKKNGYENIYKVEDDIRFIDGLINESISNNQYTLSFMISYYLFKTKPTDPIKSLLTKIKKYI